MNNQDINMTLNLLKLLEDHYEDKYEIMFECRRIQTILQKEKQIQKENSMLA